MGGGKKMSTQLIAFVAAAGLIGSGAYYKGRSDGFEKQNRIRIEISQSLYTAEQARLSAERNLLDLREKLDAQALADPDAARLSFGTDSLQRLNQIQ